MIVYEYVMTSDSGFAPNPFHGACTLACCKPKIRKGVANEIFGEIFGKIKKTLESYNQKFGQVLIGQEFMELNNNDTLFIVEGEILESEFDGASYSNMVFSADAPTNAENWGQFSDDRIIDGKLSVSEQADSDTDFFAKITH